MNVLRAARAGLALCVVMAALAASASADQVICVSGSGPGQCKEPVGLAVDPVLDRLYVADRGNDQIDVFATSGPFITSYGSQGSGPGQFEGVVGVAVDPLTHDFYVLEAGNRRLQKFTSAGEFVWMVGGDVNKTKVGASAPEAQRNFCSAASGDTCGAGVSRFTPGAFEGSGPFAGPGEITLGPGGTVYVADSQPIGGNQFQKRIQLFSPSGEQIDEILLPVDGKDGWIVGLAADSTGDFYVATNAAGGAVSKYDSSNTKSAEFRPSFNLQALATDPADNLFVSDGESGVTAISQYDAAQNPIRTFYGRGALSQAVSALAPYSNAFGDIFLAEGGGAGRVVHLSFPPPGPEIPPDASLLKANPIGSVKATLNASVNPEGEATKVHFQYVEAAICQKDVEDLGPEHCFDRAASSPEEDLGATDFHLHQASVEIVCPPEEPDGPTCLKPETKYRFRAIAKNAAGEVVSQAAEFETVGTIELGDSWSTDVGIEAATLHAAVNPRSLRTSGYFEYVDRATFEASGFKEARKSPDVDAGAGAIDFGSGEGMVSRSTPLFPLEPDTEYRYRYVVSNFFETFTGPERAFRTYPPNPAAEISCPNQLFRVGASAALPDCRAYEMVSPIDKNNADIVSSSSGYLGVPAAYFQSAESGNGVTYASVQAFADPQSASYVSQYLAKRDPAAGWGSESISPPRGRNLEDALPTLASLNNQFKAFSAELESAWLWQNADPPLGDPAGVERYWNLYRRDNTTGAYQALTTEKPPTAPRAGEDAYIPVLQGFTEDGTRAVFKAKDALEVDEGVAPNPGVPGEGSNRQIYERYDGGKLRLVSVLPNGTASKQQNSVGGGGGMGTEYFDERLSGAVSEDGSRILWTASPEIGGSGTIFMRIDGTQTVKISQFFTANFWKGSPDGSKVLFSEVGELRQYDVESEMRSTIAAGFLGFVGASEDLSRIYLVSSKALAAGGSEGQPNLYLYEAGQGFTFITAMDETADFKVTGPGPTTPSPFRRPARVTPNGSHLAFASSTSLTGYDNLDAASGQPDREVFIYDAEAGELDCASCNPSGARPRGRNLFLGSLELGWTAAQIPGWQTTFSAQRVLSQDGGRLYFESFDALLPSDSNGKMDVYQWQAPGHGDCDLADAHYFEQNGGCLALISSGTSAGDSAFADASPSGDDVFFTTPSSLVPQDYGLIDVYDARVGGGFPAPPPPPVPCEGDACQATPAAPGQTTPSSSLFEGRGNLPAARKPRRCPKGKRKVRRAGKVRCVRKHKRRGRKNAQPRAQRERRAAR